MIAIGSIRAQAGDARRSRRFASERQRWVAFCMLAGDRSPRAERPDPSPSPAHVGKARS